jgi:dipeptidyl aminopeptidase/acylaminoacyl peptidase
MKAAVVLFVCAAAWAQQPFTLEQVLSAPFPSELTAAPAGNRIAWVFDERGMRNIWVAEGPAFQARKLTPYAADDGQEVLDLDWSPDARSIAYVRGSAANRAGEYPNPTSDPKGVTQEIWVIPFAGGEPRKLGEGNSPAVSSTRVAFVRKGQIWSAPLEGKEAAEQLVRARGQAGGPQWSPDGSKLAFVSGRGDHSFIGVYDAGAKTLRFLDPSVDRDVNPVWSRDGRQVAFIRLPASSGPFRFRPRREGQPWSIRVADAETGRGREVWKAAEGQGSVFRGLGSEQQLFRTAGDRLVFPWERDGWTHLYSVALGGGAPVLLTPGEFEVEHAALSADGGEMIYSSNQGDIDGRHIWRVGVATPPARPVTGGVGIEWAPVYTSSGTPAWLASDARRPAHPVVAGRDIASETLPAAFPLQQMITPQAVILPSADGLPIHGQLFLPPAGGRRPAVIFFHGGSRRQMLSGWHYMYYYHNAYAFNQYLASRGYVVLSVNYRSGIGYGLNFREALNYGATGGSEYSDVQGAGLYLRGRPDVDPNRIGLWGGSYGGYLTAMGLARASGLFAAGVDFHGVHDWSTELNMPRGEPETQAAFESSPLAYVKGWRSPVLLIHGDDDRNVQFGQTVALVEALRRQKVDFEQIVFPDEVHDFLTHAHWLEAYRAAADFFDRKMPAKGR